MKKILNIVGRVPLSIWAIAVLVVGVLVFANPLTLICDIFSNVTKDKINGNESIVVTEVKPMGKLKLLRRFVGGFLDVPSDVPENAKDRSHFRVIYQWEGSAEFVLDLSKITRETNNVNNAIVLHMPEIEIDNLREMPISGTRCVIKRARLGYGSDADAILASMPQLVAKALSRDVDTLENKLKAREQAEYLLRTMITVTRPDSVIMFDWDS